MRTHEDIDRRSLTLARAVAARIDKDPACHGLQKARETCARWLRENPSAAVAEWMAILKKDWPDVRSILLEDSEEGRRRRQSSPFCGILSVRDRWDIYKRFRRESKAA